MHMTKGELFLELARPNIKGVSDWVDVSKFVWKYKALTLGNWGSWLRWNTLLAQKYFVVRDKEISPWNKIDRIISNFIMYCWEFLTPTSKSSTLDPLHSTHCTCKLNDGTIPVKRQRRESLISHK